MLDLGFWAGITLYPDSKASPPRAVSAYLDMLGDKGLEIPQHGAAQLQQVLTGLGTHFRIQAEGCATLVTHVFRRGDPQLASKPGFGVRDSLVADWPAQPDGGHALDRGGAR